MRLKEKKILLGVTGSIAAYKACLVLRLLQKEGAVVRVVMSAAAQRFVTPLTFETLTGEEVVTELFPPHRVERTRHVRLATWADCVLVCPATANLIGKVAHGIADDFLTTVIMASRAPVFFAPAMDQEMVQNPIYRANCQRLMELGYGFIPSEEGELASGALGQGRMADPKRVVSHVTAFFHRSPRWIGRRVLVTAGPTREPIDPVRFIGNRSSGRMGFALAEAAWYRGAEVTLVTGPTSLQAPDGVEVVRIETAAEMAERVERLWPDHDLLIMAAAVADYRPVDPHSQKIKKAHERLTITLERTPDILSQAARVKGNRIVVGFALETEEVEERAREKLQQKGLDLVCFNNPLEAGAGFETTTNRVTLLSRDGRREALGLLSKEETAGRILDAIERLMETPS